jgi:hypothetical protein
MNKTIPRVKKDTDSKPYIIYTSAFMIDAFNKALKDEADRYFKRHSVKNV